METKSLGEKREERAENREKRQENAKRTVKSVRRKKTLETQWRVTDSRNKRATRKEKDKTEQADTRGKEET